MKRFLALLMALCLCAVTPMTALAAEVETVPAVGPYLSQEEALTASTRAMNYNQVWINAGSYENGSFTVENPHTLLAQTYGTLKIESNNPNANVTVVISSGMYTIKKFVNVGPGDGELYFDSDSNASEYIVYYFVNSTNNTNGIRINCWLY